MLFISRSRQFLFSLVPRTRLLCTKVTDDQQFPRKLFSGIQPTGDVHLGNYLGAIMQWVDLQNRNENISLSIVDWHALTISQDPDELSKNILKLTATLLACGVDPDKSILFQQSQVAQHTELAWNLSCISTMARLAHLHQFKEKSASLKEVPLGLYIYPVLQTADILLYNYRATHVPVGDDQLQHLALSQELSRMFNRRFGLTFPIPHALVTDNGSSKIKSLRNPLKKMSKSDPDAKSRISLTDNPDDIMKKIRKSVTDCTSQITFDPEGRPGVSNLIRIHSALTGKSVEAIWKESDGLDTLKYKYRVAECVISFLSPITKKITELKNNQDYLEDVLQKGANKAAEVAEDTMQEVRCKLGIRFTNVKKQKFKVSI